MEGYTGLLELANLFSFLFSLFFLVFRCGFTESYHNTYNIDIYMRYISKVRFILYITSILKRCRGCFSLLVIAPNQRGRFHSLSLIGVWMEGGEYCNLRFLFFKISQCNFPRSAEKWNQAKRALTREESKRGTSKKRDWYFRMFSTTLWVISRDYVERDEVKSIGNLKYEKNFIR